MKYSVFTVMMPEFSLEETINKLKELGYDGVEWRVHEGFHLSPDGIEEKAESVGRNCREAGLEINALASYLQIEQKELIRKLAGAAGVMGCGQFRVCAPLYDGKINYNRLYDKAIKDLAEIEKIATRYRVKANLEIHMGNIMPSAGLAHRLVSNFDPQHIGVIYDPGNMVYEGMENWQMGLELLGEYLAHVHVKNSAWYKKEGKWQATWAGTKEGIVDWSQVISALKAVNYQGYLSFEDFSDTPVEEKLANNLKYLRGLEQK